MPTQEIDEEESHRNGFFYFVEALRVLSRDAEIQCEEMGNYNTPWEIKDDVISGAGLANSPHIALAQEPRQKISSIVTALQSLPVEAIEPTGMNMVTHTGCLAGMTHPAWEPLREAAREILVSIHPAIEETKQYFRMK